MIYLWKTLDFTGNYIIEVSDGNIPDYLDGWELVVKSKNPLEVYTNAVYVAAKCHDDAANHAKAVHEDYTSTGYVTPYL